MVNNVFSLSEQEIFRRDSLEKLKNKGINPYPAEEYFVTDYSIDIKKKFRDVSPKWEVSVAGRMMLRRIMGKTSFVDLQDSVGRIQLYINSDNFHSDTNKNFYSTIFKKLFDIGDFIGATGYVFRTQMGEVSIHVTNLTLLAKSLRPIPIVKSKDGAIYDAFNDTELRYRQRYLDLILNERVKDVFFKRTKIFNSMRDFLNKKGYLEVDTPILQSIPGGATSRPFITHYNALGSSFYLRIANELYLKRLIVGGFEGVYEFSRNFRNEGMDKMHNPEFTAMEIYVSYKDYNWMMNFTEQMLEYICTKVLGSTKINMGKYIINFKAPYRRITIISAIKESIGIDISEMNEDQLRKLCYKLHIIEVDNKIIGKSQLIDEIFSKKCECNYIQPTFIIDYPKEMSPLCKIHRQNTELTERFELIVNGHELANAYSELNDPIDQRNRFEEQVKVLKKGNNEEEMFIDQDFLRALEYGMPPTAGMGIGMDRLVMLLTGQTSIQEVLLFPHMRPEKSKKLIHE